MCQSGGAYLAKVTPFEAAMRTVEQSEDISGNCQEYLLKELKSERWGLEGRGG